jgi:hypothetical protein
VVGLTDRRLIELQVKSMGNTSEQNPFAAEFHRAFSKQNRPSAVAICEAIDPGAPAR